MMYLHQSLEELRASTNILTSDLLTHHCILHKFCLKTVKSLQSCLVRGRVPSTTHILVYTGPRLIIIVFAALSLPITFYLSLLYLYLYLSLLLSIRIVIQQQPPE